jgi:hypothetical protein
MLTSVLINFNKRICLGITGQDCTETYVVQPGDTCNAIVNATHVDKKILLDNNQNIGDCSFIYSGEASGYFFASQMCKQFIAFGMI